MPAGERAVLNGSLGTIFFLGLVRRPDVLPASRKPDLNWGKMPPTLPPPAAPVIPPQDRERPAPFDALFNPHTVALIGATDRAGSVGHALWMNLSDPASTRLLYAVNPERSELEGYPCFANIASVPKPVDLAVIATPARTVPGVVGECARAGVRAAVIISAGFRETGAEGAALEQRILDAARGSSMRIIGPNCLGVMRPSSGLNATFASSMARPGRLGFISQSGALCTAILDWSQREMVGFSAFVSIGSMLDAGWGDLIHYLGDDPQTRSIILYMESIGDARTFLSAAREIALTKPIIVLKPGRTEAAAKAAASHTGALTGQDDVLDSAFRRCGVLRVNTIAELFYLAEALDKQPRPRGPRLTVVTNAGGPAVLAADATLSEGGQLASLSKETLSALDEILPPHWSHQNPVDILGDADAGRFAKAVDLAAKDPSTDGLLVILAPQALTDPATVAEQMTPFAHLPGKPVIASWMGGQSVERGEAILNRAGIPVYAYPDSAARVFQLMWRYSANLRALYQTPQALEAEVPDGTPSAQARGAAMELVERVRASGRTLLTEAESKSLLEAYGIPAVRTVVARDAEGAVRAAEEIGYPVVVKLHSETVTHKTDMGGVRLNLSDAEEVRRAFEGILATVAAKAGREHFLGVTVQPMVRMEGYELILGSTIDPQFGPVLLFGSGGQLVEVYKDRVVDLPPLNTTLAHLLMERTRIYTALGGVRGRRPVDVAALARLLVQFSYLVVELSAIREIDINPLMASPDGLLALDARVILHPREVKELPRPAIRPYPVQYAEPWKLNDGTDVTIRPIRPEDEPAMVRFHHMLSDRSVYQRYFHFAGLSQRISHDRLVRICFNDYDREIALVVETSAERLIIAVGRLTKARLANEAELAFLIADEYQGRGLGSELGRRLVEIGRSEKLERVTLEVLADNSLMLNLAKDLGFKLSPPFGGVVHGEMELD
jgi:acetyltransferase